jgi:deoxyribonuclease IV
MPLRAGAHVAASAALAEATERGADVVQVFLSDPRGFAEPTVDSGLVELAAADIHLYVHSPYVINVASANNRVRVPSRRLLQKTVDAAAAAGARGVVVHGGHLPGDAPEVGIANWRKAAEQLELHCPVLIENAAGGSGAMTRTLDDIARLWDAVGPYGLGFCLDTCHAHAAGLDFAVAADQLRAITGRIDLVHANDSRDAAGSGRDRHANIGSGHIDLTSLSALISRADAPAVCETPGGSAEHATDISWLREHCGTPPLAVPLTTGEDTSS